jgi:hypothetical protein
MAKPIPTDMAVGRVGGIDVLIRSSKVTNIDQTGR